MPTLRSYSRGLEAGRASTHDEHVPRVPREDGDAPSVLELPAGLGVLDARDRETGMEVTDAGLVASDAGPDVIDAAQLPSSAVATGRR